MTSRGHHAASRRCDFERATFATDRLHGRMRDDAGAGLARAVEKALVIETGMKAGHVLDHHAAVINVGGDFAVLVLARATGS